MTTEELIRFVEGVRAAQEKMFLDFLKHGPIAADTAELYRRELARTGKLKITTIGG